MSYPKSTPSILLLALIILFLTSSASSQVGRLYDENYENIWKQWLKKFPVSEDAIELELKFSFPTPGQEKRDVFLWGATRIAQLSNGNIIVLNKKACELLIFDEKGNYIKRIGKKGQGPGEFSLPIGLSVSSEFIVVSDTGNMNIQFFNLSGNFIKSFKIFKAYLDIAVNKDGLIYAIPNRVTPESLLVDVLDMTGKLHQSFAEAEFGNNQSIWKTPNLISLSLNDDSEIFVAYEFFPLVCKYSDKNILNAKYTIDLEVINKHIEPNYDNIKKNKKGAYWRVAITSIRSSSDRFYILHNYPRIEILEYDYIGRLQNDYYYNVESHEALFYDFLVIEREEGKTFYLLKRDPVNEILILRPKKIRSNLERR